MDFWHGDVELETFIKACDEGKWRKALDMYKEKKELRTAKINPVTGDTALHMAVSDGREYVVKEMVNIVCGNNNGRQDNNKPPLTTADENGDEKKLVLEAENAEGNIPLHLAASKGNAEMSKVLSRENTASIGIRNKKGETPLFLSVVSGNNKETFLWLYHYLHENRSYSTDCVLSIIRRDDGDTILHWALEEKRMDLAIEIVLLYHDYLPDIVLMKNKYGLSPLHLLATTPSVFRSTYCLDQPFIAQLLYKLIMTLIRVKKKKATTMQDLEQDERTPSFEFKAQAARLISFITSEVMFKRIRSIKEVQAWSLQIMEELLIVAGDKNMSENPYKVNDCMETESTIIVETPLMVAAKNGIIEMVDKFQQHFPVTMSILNEEEKNIVLIAAETRQTDLYQFLMENEQVDKKLFEQVDRDGNTALHLAAKPGDHISWQTTTVMEEFKWFEFVKCSLPPTLRKKYNNKGKTAKAIFRESYKKHMTSVRQWLNQTSQAFSLASTLIAAMAFSNFAGENINRKNNSSLVALSLSLISTIFFLAIPSCRPSLHFWRYVPFILQFAIFTLLGSIVALWTSLMLHGQSIKACVILGLPIAIFSTIGSLHIFIVPSLIHFCTKVPAPSRNTVGAIRYLKPQNNNNGRPTTIQAQSRIKRRRISS